MRPELVTLAAPELAKIPYAPPVMAAPALLVGVALIAAEMPAKAVPKTLPELVRLVDPVMALIPNWPPEMLAPALLVTVASPRPMPPRLPVTEALLSTVTV